MLTDASRSVCSLISSCPRDFSSCWSLSFSSTTTCTLFFIPESSSYKKQKQIPNTLSIFFPFFFFLRNATCRLHTLSNLKQCFYFVDYQTIQHDMKHGRLMPSIHFLKYYNHILTNKKLKHQLTKRRLGEDSRWPANGHTTGLCGF